MTNFHNPLLSTRDHVKAHYKLAPRALKIRVPFTIRIDPPQKESNALSRRLKTTRSLSEILDDPESIQKNITTYLKHHYDLDSTSHDVLSESEIEFGNIQQSAVFPKHFSLQQVAIVNPEIERLSVNNPEMTQMDESNPSQQLFSFGASISFPNLSHTSTPMDVQTNKKGVSTLYRKVIDMTGPMHVLGGERHQAVMVLSDEVEDDLVLQNQRSNGNKAALLLETDTRAVLPIRFPNPEPDQNISQGVTTSYFDPLSKRVNAEYPKERLALHGFAFSEDSMFPTVRPFIKLMKGTDNEGKLQTMENVMLHPDSYMFGLFSNVAPLATNSIEDLVDEEVALERYMAATHQIRDLLMHVRSTSFDHAHVSFLFKDNNPSDPVVALRGTLVIVMIPIIPDIENVDQRLFPYHNQVTHMEKILS